MTPYEVFFGRKYPYRTNSLATIDVSNPAVENAFNILLEYELQDDVSSENDEDEDDSHTIEKPTIASLASDDEENNSDCDRIDASRDDEEHSYTPDASDANDDDSRPMDKVVCQTQAVRREQMAKKYNGTHQVYSFKVGDIVTVAILSKDRAVNDPPKMEAEIVAIPHENHFRLQTEYRVLANHYPTSELNLVPPELLEPLVARLSGSNKPPLTLTLHAAAALRSPASSLSVKCGCKSKCDTRRCICVKSHVQCTQYCHSGHLDCSNLPPTIAEQTETPLVPQNNKPEPSLAKRKRGELTPAKSTKKLLLDHTKPLPRMPGLQPTTATSLLTRARSGKTLAQYPNTAGVVAQLASICSWTVGRDCDKKGKDRSENDDVANRDEMGGNDNDDSDADEDELEAESEDNDDSK
ncbi:hypothetical protein MMC07_009798 [Pseudocyphellaria aurata]|nr:hypothetical protein [Pseudocyphellaria aurata]